MHMQKVPLFLSSDAHPEVQVRRSDSNPTGDPAISQESQPLPGCRHACTPRAVNVQVCFSKLTREQAYHSITDTHSLTHWVSNGRATHYHFLVHSTMSS